MADKDTKKRLERHELIQLLYELERQQRLKAEAEALGRRAEVANIRAENIRYKIQVLNQEAAVLQKEAETKRSLAREVKVQYDNYVKELAGKYDLPTNWAYAESDGEIIVPEQDNLTENSDG